MEKNFKMVAKTFFGFEDILAKEVQQLGGQDVQTGTRVVTFSGDKGFMYKANLSLRTALKILKPIKIFRCNNQFQGIVRQKSFVMVNGNPNSFEGYIIGISDDNIKWEFVNIGETRKKNVVKYYPFVCEEILKQIKN